MADAGLRLWRIEASCKLKERGWRSNRQVQVLASSIGLAIDEAYGHFQGCDDVESFWIINAIHVAGDKLYPLLKAY